MANKLGFPASCQPATQCVLTCGPSRIFGSTCRGARPLRPFKWSSLTMGLVQGDTIPPQNLSSTYIRKQLVLGPLTCSHRPVRKRTYLNAFESLLLDPLVSVGIVFVDLPV